MPVLNSRGDALMGIDGLISVNGTLIDALVGYQAGGWRWLTDDVIAGQACVSTCALLSVDLRAPGQPPATLDPYGANEFRAGAGQWLAYLTPPQVRGTIVPATGHGNALYDLGRDGVGVIKPHQAADSGVSLVTAAWSLTWPSNIFVAYQDGLLLSRAPDGLTLYDVNVGMPTLIPDLLAMGALGGRLCRGKDGYGYEMLFWRGATVVQRLGTFDGWLIRFANDDAKIFDYNPDVVAIDTNTLHVVSSKFAGERPEELQRYVIDLLQPPIDLRELEPPVTMPDVGRVAAVNRPLYVGPYQFNTYVGRRL